SALLIKRGKPPGEGQWSIPGGAVKVGETTPEGLAREMTEEIGMTVTVGPLVELLERIFLDDEGRPVYHYVLLDYLCFPKDGVLHPGSDAADAKFVPPEEWEDYDLPAITLQVMKKALRMLPEASHSDQVAT
ncbi:MAG: NUDIX hydrolase, partial [Deltaproteobacteria bacterium]|nr:NUDIX hydrolase [Deltaproteobacteria bacterium]